MISRKKILVLSIGLALSSSNLMADESNLEIEKILVTAQKRVQNLQEVPIAVTAFNSDDLKQVGIVTISDLANITPGLSISESQAEETSIVMRGIGSNDFGFSSDESIPIYLDGVYLGSGVSTLGDLTDIAQIEVLKGPQGTLFGRNAIGGAVNITTARPTSEVEGNFTVGYGDYNLKTLTGMVNLPLVDDELMLRVTGSVRKRDGWQQNEATNLTDGYAQDRWNTRAKLLWTPSEKLEVTLTIDANEEDDHPGYTNTKDGEYANLLAQFGMLSDATFDSQGTQANNGNLYFDLNKLASEDPFSAFDGPAGEPTDFVLSRKTQGSALKIDYAISDSLTFSSISSYRSLKSDITEDNDGTEYLLFNIRSLLDTTELNQEFRLSGQSESVDWFVGLSAYKSDVEGRVDDEFGATIGSLLGVDSLTETAIVDADTLSYAIFGDAIWSITDKTNITAGVRASYDKKKQVIKNPQDFGLIFASPNQFLDENYEVDPSLAESEKTWNNVSPRLVVDHKLDENTLIFAGVSQGYKSGGFNSFPTVDRNQGSPTFGAVPFGSTDPFDEEKVTNYEAGVKSLLLDNRLKLNASVYYYDFTDLQFLLNEEQTVKAVNAGSAQGKGIDIDTMYLLTEDLTVTASVAWLDATFGESVTNDMGDIIAQKGQKLAYSPEFTGTVSLDHYIELGDMGEFRTNVNYSYTDEQYLAPGENDIYSADSHSLLSARISYTSAEGDWQLSVWGTNLTDEATFESIGSLTDDFGFIPSRRNEPRMFGVEFSYFYQ